MGSDTLRERVAEELWQASSIRAVGQRRVITWADAGPPTWNQWYPLADAAIALVLEEAARVAEMLGGSVRKGNIIEALYVPPTAKDIAAAIRALKEDSNANKA